MEPFLTVPSWEQASRPWICGARPVWCLAEQGFGCCSVCTSIWEAKPFWTLISDGEASASSHSHLQTAGDSELGRTAEDGAFWWDELTSGSATPGLELRGQGEGRQWGAAGPAWGGCDHGSLSSALVFGEIRRGDAAITRFLLETAQVTFPGRLFCPTDTYPNYCKCSELVTATRNSKQLGSKCLWKCCTSVWYG